MSLPDDLLEQANHLALRELRRPKQASLRRAISTAYYALFHLLVADASARLIGTTNANARLRDQTARAFQHTEMKKVCVAFGKGYGGLPPHLQQLIPPAPFPDLVLCAKIFTQLQETRHEADYERSRRYRRVEVLALLEDTTDAFAAWERVRGSNEARVFLVALLLDSRWNR